MRFPTTRTGLRLAVAVVAATGLAALGLAGPAQAAPESTGQSTAVAAPAQAGTSGNWPWG